MLVLQSSSVGAAPLEMSDAGTAEVGTVELSIGASGSAEPTATVEAAVGATERWELSAAVGFEGGIDAELASKIGLLSRGEFSLAAEAGAALPMKGAPTELGVSVIASVELGLVTSSASAIGTTTGDGVDMSAGTMLSLGTMYVQPAIEVVADVTTPERNIRTGASVATTIRDAVIHVSWQHDFQTGSDAVWGWLTLSFAPL